MTLMVTHLLLLLKGHFNALWMFKGHTVIKPTVYRLQIIMVGLGQREDTLIQDCLEYKLTQLIGECMYIKNLTNLTHYDSEISAWETYHKEDHNDGRKQRLCVKRIIKALFVISKKKKERRIKGK